MGPGGGRFYVHRLYAERPLFRTNCGIESGEITGFGASVLPFRAGTHSAWMMIEQVSR